jgi:hypothetical protein
MVHGLTDGAWDGSVAMADDHAAVAGHEPQGNQGASAERRQQQSQ